MATVGMGLLGVEDDNDDVVFHMDHSNGMHMNPL